MKETLELLKKLMSNKKTRSLAILLLYFIFFIFVFALINNSTPSESLKEEQEKKEEQVLEGIEKLQQLETYRVNIKSDIEFTFDYKTNTYEYLDNNYIKGEDDDIFKEYNLEIFTSTNIYNLLKKATLESTSYLNNTDTYLISIGDFEKIVNNIDNDNANYIKLVVYKDNYDKVEIDFNSYYNYNVLIEFGG